jgi:hypothetical protein
MGSKYRSHSMVTYSWADKDGTTHTNTIRLDGECNELLADMAVRLSALAVLEKDIVDNSRVGPRTIESVNLTAVRRLPHCVQMDK